MESVLITMKTKQITPDDEEETELMTAGTCERKDGVLTLSYEDTDATGFPARQPPYRWRMSRW